MSQRKRRLFISPGFLLLGAILFYWDGTVVLWAALAAVLHELGHCIALLLMGGRVASLSLTAIGAELKLDCKHPLSYPRELLVALAGPAVSVLTAWVAAKTGAFLLAGLSLALGAFNLLPVRALDGGRALYAATAGLFRESGAAVLTHWASYLTVAALIGLGLGALRLFGNFTLLLTALWLLTSLREGPMTRRLARR